MRTLLLMAALVIAPALVAQERIVVKMEPVDGLGPFQFNWTGQGPASDPMGGQFDPLEDSLVGLPIGLTEMDVRFVDLQTEEAYRMGYLKGNVKKAEYDRARRYRQAPRPPDSLTLDQRLDYAVGKDANGKFAVVFDTDNDEDLSDEIVHSIPWDGPPMSIQTFLDSVMNNPSSYDDLVRSLPAIDFETEVFADGRVQPLTKRVVIMPFLYVPSLGPGVPDKPIYFIGYAGHKLGQIGIDGIGYDIAINTAEALYRPWGTWIHVPDTARLSVVGGPDVAVGDANPLQIGDVFVLGQRRFRLNRVSLLGDELELVDVTSRSLVRSGNTPPPIAAETVGGEVLSPEDVAGKYVLLDFWNTGCASCFDDRINATWTTVNKSCIDFVGVGENSPSEVNDYALARGISWPQIADADGVITAAYGVSAYPTRVLVNPVGEVFSTDGRFETEGRVSEMLDRFLPAACFNAPTPEEVASLVSGNRGLSEPADYFIDGCSFAMEDMSVASIGDRNPDRGWPATLDISGECTGHEGAERQGTWHQDMTLNIWIYQNMGEWAVLARDPFVVLR